MATEVVLDALLLFCDDTSWNLRKNHQIVEDIFNIQACLFKIKTQHMILFYISATAHDDKSKRVITAHLPARIIYNYSFQHFGAIFVERTTARYLT